MKISFETDFQYSFKCSCGESFKSDSKSIIIESIKEHNCFNKKEINISCEYCKDSIEMNIIGKDIIKYIASFINIHFCNKMKKIKENREIQNEEKEINNNMKGYYDIFYR